MPLVCQIFALGSDDIFFLIDAEWNKQKTGLVIMRGILVYHCNFPLTFAFKRRCKRLATIVPAVPAPRIIGTPCVFLPRVLFATRQRQPYAVCQIFLEDLAQNVQCLQRSSSSGCNTVICAVQTPNVAFAQYFQMT